MKGKMRQDLYKELWEVENKHWWHHHKRQVVHQFIKRFATKGRVLDIGAGTGKILSELKQRNWQVSGVDGEREAASWSKKRGVQVKLVDLEKGKLPFGENEFDLVLILDTLEHLKKEENLLREVKRVLKKQGVVLLTVPSYQWLFSYWDRMLGHQRRYTRKLLKNRCEEVGFTVEYLGYFFSLFLLPVIAVRIAKGFLGKRAQEISDFQSTPLPVLTLPIMKLYTKLERFFLRFTRMPFGLSILCVARKA